MNAFVGALILCLPAAPFLLLCFRRGFIRRACMFRRAFLILVGGLAGYVSLVVVMAWLFPHLLLWLIAFAAPPVFYLLYWRAQPRFGTDRGLPPGSLQLAPSGPWRDYLFYLKQAERFGPVFKMNNFIQPMICLQGIKRGNDFLKQHEQSTVTPPMPFNSHVPRGFMRYMAPDLNLEYRNRMKPIFSDRRFLDRKADSIEQSIRTYLVASGVNPVLALENMTFAALADLFFGVSTHDPEFGRLSQLYREIDYRHSFLASWSGTERRLEEIERIFLARVNTLPSYFRDFLRPSASDQRSWALDKTLVRNFIYLLQTSWIDVSDLLLWILKYLSEHPRWMETLQTHLRAAERSGLQFAQDLARRVVLETLRLEQSEYIMRKALHDLHFEGFLIPKGWLVRIGVRESHRDGAIYDDPHSFNPDRFLANPYRIRQYSPFGLQQKSCLGKRLTLVMAERFVLALARDYRCTVMQDGPRELGAFHWRPSSKWRVKILPCSTAGNLCDVGPSQHTQLSLSS